MMDWTWTQTTLIVEESTIHNNGLSNDWEWCECLGCSPWS